MPEPFQFTRIDDVTGQVTWHGEYVFFVHKSAVWHNDWRGSSQRKVLTDDQDMNLKVLLRRLKIQCEKAVVV